MKTRTRRKSEATRERILKAALRQFRRRGFDRTTMREIADASQVALGAAYYYFPTKSAIVLAYYEWIQEEHVARMREAMAKARGLRARLGTVMHTKLAMLQKDRKLLAALFRSAAEPGDPKWVFGAPTRSVREQNIAVFEAAIGDEPLPADLRRLLPDALWLIQAGLLLYYVNDRSPGQERTRRLTDAVLDLVCDVLPLLALPGLDGVRARLVSLLSEAGLR